MVNMLVDGPPPEVLLSSPPLARVICVLSFSPVMKIADPTGAGVAEFQEKIRQKYPTLSQEQMHAFQFNLNNDAVPAQPMLIAQTVWRFFDKDMRWRVSLTRETLGIETENAYTNRAEFVERLVNLCVALREAYQPAQRLRLGIRYVNVLGKERLDRLSDLVSPEFLAFGNAPFREHLAFSHQNAEFVTPEGGLIVRFGVLGRNQTHDPLVLEPTDEQRYFLDLDAVAVNPVDFSETSIAADAKALAERIYTVFRQATTPALLESCNAD